MAPGRRDVRFTPKADIRYETVPIWSERNLRAPSIRARFLWTPFQHFSDLSGRFAAYLVAASFKLRQSRMFKLCQFFPFVFALISTIDTQRLCPRAVVPEVN
jgi:hypothetical protein